jgi:hypothetical protein
LEAIGQLHTPAVLPSGERAPGYRRLDRLGASLDGMENNKQLFPVTCDKSPISLGTDFNLFPVSENRGEGTLKDAATCL